MELRRRVRKVMFVNGVCKYQNIAQALIAVERCKEMASVKSCQVCPVAP